VSTPTITNPKAASPTNTTILLTWGVSTEETVAAIRAYIRPKGTGVWFSEGLSADARSHMFTGLQPSAAYEWGLRPIVGGTAVTGTIKTLPVPVPVTPPAPVLSVEGDVVSWAAIPGVSSYELATVRNPSTTRDTAYTTVTGTSVTVTAIPGETVNYGLRANTPVQGPWAQEVSIAWAAVRWLGLNGNSAGAYLGAIGDFAKLGVTGDRSNHLDWPEGYLPVAGDGLDTSLKAGMVPFVILNTNTEKWGVQTIPRTTQTVTTYAQWAVDAIKATLALHPAFPGYWSLINEPYGHGTAPQYADIVHATLTLAQEAGLDLSRILVSAYGADDSAGGNGEQWVTGMYTQQPTLASLVQAWEFHPYGLATEDTAGHNRGLQGMQSIRGLIQSGLDNIYVTEVGFWAPDVNEGKARGEPEATSSTDAALKLTAILETTRGFRTEGWLKWLLVYSRQAGGWAMQTTGGLTKQGEALAAFAEQHA
jgi:hypothetical protein